ncbi:MAG: division/cell wall cluster transcriptional repressor MraZ [Pseudomonadota bacterium]
MDELFIGSAICEVTSGGEILLPRAFHETAQLRSPNGQWFIGLHEEQRCLVVYDRAFAAQQQWDFETRRAAFIGSNLEAHYTRLRRTFGFVETIRLAPDGMMMLGALMRERGRIGASALLVATGQRFEIWDLDYVLARGPSDLVTLATLHLKIQLANEDCHGPALPSVDSRRRPGNLSQPGFHLQQMPSLRPRHDPVDGISSNGVEGDPPRISGRVEKH